MKNHIKVSLIVAALVALGVGCGGGGGGGGGEDDGGLGLADPTMSLTGGASSFNGYVVTGTANQVLDGGKLYGLFSIR